MYYKSEQTKKAYLAWSQITNAGNQDKMIVKEV